MKSITRRGSLFRSIILSFISLFLAALMGCSVAEPKTVANSEIQKQTKPIDPANSSDGTAGASIPIETNSPADTVRAFYRLLRERKFREAMFLTNLKPAIQSLNDNEMQDFALDFEAIAGQVPQEVQINGEIISGDKATVTVKLPKADSDENETQPVKLRRDGDVWMIMTADDQAAAQIKKEGKKYFYNLRITTHQEEAAKMLERIAKAELAHSLQNGGAYTDMQTLISSGLLPDDAQNSDSTGYYYSVDLIPDKNQYTAAATPADYGKSGKLSFLLYLDNKGMSRVRSKDTRGEPLRK